MREVSLLYEGGGKFRASSTYWEKRSDELFKFRSMLVMHEHKERSLPSHRQFFAVLKAAYANLPEMEAIRYPTAEIFRGMALIETGHFRERVFCATSHTEAIRTAKFMETDDRVQVIAVNKTLVVERRPLSQSFEKMDHETFQRVKDDIIVWAAEKLGVEPQALLESAADNA